MAGPLKYGAPPKTRSRGITWAQGELFGALRDGLRRVLDVSEYFVYCTMASAPIPSAPFGDAHRELVTLSHSASSAFNDTAAATSLPYAPIMVAPDPSGNLKFVVWMVQGGPCSGANSCIQLANMGVDRRVVDKPRWSQITIIDPRKGVFR